MLCFSSQTLKLQTSPSFIHSFPLTALSLTGSRWIYSLSYELDGIPVYHSASHTPTQSYAHQFRVANPPPVHACGRKPKALEESPRKHVRTCKTPYRKWPKHLSTKSGILELWGNNTSRCTTGPAQPEISIVLIVIYVSAPMLMDLQNKTFKKKLNSDEKETECILL